MNNSFSLLEGLKEGWRHIYRGKKAHRFKDYHSLCGKYTITEYESGGLLPQNAFMYKDELCPKCLLKLSKGG